MAVAKKLLRALWRETIAHVVLVSEHLTALYCICEVCAVLSDSGSSVLVLASTVFACQQACKNVST